MKGSFIRRAMMESLENIDLNDLGTILLLYFFLFAVIFLRFLIVSGVYHYVFLVIFREKFEKGILVTETPNSRQVKREMILSVYSALIFGLFGLGLLVLWHVGFTKIYLDTSEYPLWYIPLSILIFLFLHDTYYYWLHRWMHNSKWLRRAHMEHHKSVNTTVLTAFSFHPMESFLQAFILPVLFMILPMHLISVIVVLTTMTISATINHAGVEIFSKNSRLGKLMEFFIGATHHDLHHRHAKRNLGLYFTFWDKLMKTEY